MSLIRLLLSNYQNIVPKDGHIDFREFMIVLYIMSNGTPEENLKQIFRVFDINNDGDLSKKKMLQQQLFEMVVIAGFISPKELQRIVKDLFHLINEENADEASQELLAQSGNKWTYLILIYVTSDIFPAFIKNIYYAFPFNISNPQSTVTFSKG